MKLFLSVICFITLVPIAYFSFEGKECLSHYFFNKDIKKVWLAYYSIGGNKCIWSNDRDVDVFLPAVPLLLEECSYFIRNSAKDLEEIWDSIEDSCEKNVVKKNFLAYGTINEELYKNKSGEYDLISFYSSKKDDEFYFGITNMGQYSFIPFDDLTFIYKVETTKLELLKAISRCREKPDNCKFDYRGTFEKGKTQGMLIGVIKI